MCPDVILCAMIGSKVEATPEFSIFRCEGRFLIELDGVPVCSESALEDAHGACVRAARKRKLRNVGVTEVFGRNRQFIIGPKGGLQRRKF